MKKWIISLVFLALGVACSALMAEAAQGNYEAARMWTDHATYFTVMGMSSIILSLVFLTAGVVLMIKGTDNMVGMEE
jgi:hypothetical protein